jgi:hypothetical protein
LEQNAGRLVRRAAQVLDDRKWIQNSVGNGQLGMCARGAIRFAAFGNTNSTEASDFTYQAEVQFSRWLMEAGAASSLGLDLRYALEENVSIVPSWNDANGRTKDEVIQYMRKFADEVDPQLR